MNIKRVIIYVVLILIAVVGGGYIININIEANDTREISKSEENVSGDRNVQNVSGYTFETTDKNVINKEFDGEYLDSFITIALEQEEEFLVNLKGIDSSSKVYLINPDNGETTPLEYNDGIFTTRVKLSKDINYGIIIDYSLLGGIRIVEDINSINKEQLVKDMLTSMGCGL